MPKGAIGRLGAAAALLLAAVAALLAYPSPLFAYSASYGAFDVMSDRPIGPAMAEIVADAERRLRTSELYRPDERFRLFICNARWRLLLLARSGSVGGSTETLVTRNIYIRAADIESNRVLIGGARLADAEARPLSYFIAHEAVHAIQSRRFGRLMKLRYPSWLIEGHADLVAKGGDFDLAANRALLNLDHPLLSEREARRGLYRRYHLMVASLLERRRTTPARLFEQPPTAAEALAAARSGRPVPAA